MVIGSNIHAECTSELKYIFDHVNQKFGGVFGALQEAQEKVGYFIKSLLSLSQEEKKTIFQKITHELWHVLLDALRKCISDIKIYLNIIDCGLESFKKLMYLSSGNVDETFLELTETIIELFFSVQIAIEDHMKDFQGVIENLLRPSPLQRPFSNQ